MGHTSTLKAESLTLSHKCTSWSIQTLVKYRRICNNIPTGSAGLMRLHARKGIFSSLVGSYQEELLSGRIIVRGKKKMAKGHKRKRRFPLLRKQETKTSCWTRNITTSVSLKTWQKLYILSCVGHCVNKNKQRKGAEERATHVFFMIRTVLDGDTDT